MKREFIHYDDMEPGDLCRKLDRLPSHEFPYTHQFVTVEGVSMAWSAPLEWSGLNVSA